MHSIFLRYLDETARQGSIRKAAAVLNVSSTAVNRKIISVEEQLGVKLLSRTAEGVELTAAGRIVLEHCRRTLMEYRQVQLRLGDIRDLRAAHIGIATIDSVSMEFLPRVLELFQEEHPETSFTINHCQPEEVMSAVAAGEADIGVSFVLDLHPDVRAVARRGAVIGIILRADHPLAERSSLSVHDIADYTLVRTTDARGRHSIIDQVVTDSMVQSQATLFTNSLPLARKMILAGRGIGLYTRLGFLSELESGILRFVPLDAQQLNDLRIGVLVSARRPLEPASAVMCDMIADRLKRLNLG